MSLDGGAAMDAADRGGSVGRRQRSKRATIRAVALRITPAESSPIDGAGAATAIAILAVLCAVAGLWGFGSGAYIVAKAHVAQVLLDLAWHRTQSAGEPVKPWPWADTRTVARLVAPGHGVDLYVLAGASGRTLAFGPGHLDGTAVPGMPGNSVLSAHRDTHFRFLADLGAGDELIVETPAGVRTRSLVTHTEIGDHRALRLPRESEAPTLTLVTCYPFDAIVPGGPLRYVVVADSVESTLPFPTLSSR